jgi:hypothetical protein
MQTYITTSAFFALSLDKPSQEKTLASAASFPSAGSSKVFVM